MSTPLQIWNEAMAKEWVTDDLSTVVTGEIVDTGERILRVTAVTTLGDTITLHFKDGPPYEADADNLIDVYRSTPE